MVYGGDSSATRGRGTETKRANVIAAHPAQVFLVRGSSSPDQLQSVPVRLLAQVWPLTNGASTAKLGTR